MIDGSENPVNSLTSLSSLVVEVSHCLQGFFLYKKSRIFRRLYSRIFSKTIQQRQRPRSPWIACGLDVPGHIMKFEGWSHGDEGEVVKSLLAAWPGFCWNKMFLEKKINKTYILPPHCVEKWWIYPSVKNTLNKSKMIKQKDVTGLDQVESTKAASTLPQLPKTPHPLPPNTVPTSSYPIHHGTWWSFKNHSST